MSLISNQKRYNIEESIALLKKEIENNPGEDWMLYLLPGFDYFFYLKDYATAAEYLEIAARTPGHPAYLPKLVARMYAKADKTDTAIQFLESMYQQYNDPGVKASIAERIKILVAKREAQSLRQFVDRYKEIYGFYPEKPEALVNAGLVKQINIYPGGRYTIDQNTGEIDWVSDSSPNWP